MYEGFSTFGYNFVSLKVVDGECKLERLGRGLFPYDREYCVPLGDIRQQFRSGDIILAGVRDTPVQGARRRRRPCLQPAQLRGTAPSGASHTR